MGLSKPLLRALERQGYHTPTEVQQQAIPTLLKGRDLLVSAQTGTGKTAAFSIPIIEQLTQAPATAGNKRAIRALVVTPTRELAIQVADSFRNYGQYTGLKIGVVYGGVKQYAQTRSLRQGIDVLVATPGRLLDLTQQGHIDLSHVAHLVLDEADQMMDMGFIHDIRRIVALVPTHRQSLFFSATLPPAIVKLSKQILGEQPAQLVIRPQQTTAAHIDQSVYFVARKRKLPLLLHLLQDKPEATLVFSRTKHGADKLARILNKEGIHADAIHGNKSQAARQKTLCRFKQGHTRVLVATDVAARGIDVAHLSRVINFDLPSHPQTYVHRIGRTGRATQSGEALSFCDHDERPYLQNIQRLIKQQIAVCEGHPFEDTTPMAAIPTQRKKPRQRRSFNRKKH